MSGSPRCPLFGGFGQESEIQTMTRAGRRASAAGRIAVALVVLIGAGFGCASSRSPFIAQADARINIEVINHGFEDATLHAIQTGSQRRRMGTVHGTMTANFVLPWSYTDRLQIEIRLLAGPRCTTREIWASPGDVILLEIQSRLLPYCGV